MGAAAAVVAASAMQRVLRAFRDASATSMFQARTLADLRLDSNPTLRGLISGGAVKEASPGTYYLDEPAFQALMARRRTTAVVVLMTFVILGAIAAWLFAKP